MVISYKIKAEANQEPIRLDLFLFKTLGKKENFTRSVLTRMIKEGWVNLNGQIELKASKKIKPHDEISIAFSAQETADQEELPILYEDDLFVAINKPSGLITHPVSLLVFKLKQDMATALGLFKKPSVLGWILKSYPRASELPRYGIIHRLDAATSGVLLIAKTKPTYSAALKLFATHKIKKTYRAFVWGSLEKKEGMISSSLLKKYGKKMRVATAPKGQTAETAFRVLKYHQGTTEVELYPKTGRTHQLRVHLASIGHPICGDPLYTTPRTLHPTPCFSRLMLHALSLKFRHPKTKKTLEIKAPLPSDFLHRSSPFPVIPAKAGI